MASYKYLNSVLRAYWRGKIDLTVAVLRLMSDFNVKLISINEDGAQIFDLDIHEYQNIYRSEAPKGGISERQLEDELANYPTEESEAAINAAVESVIDAVYMHELGIDVKNSHFSIRVHHLAYLSEEEMDEQD